MKQIALILTLLLAAAGASAQEVFIGADFDTRFDNRDHSDCNIDDSHTFFSMRLTPKAGVIWAEKKPAGGGRRSVARLWRQGTQVLE